MTTPAHESALADAFDAAYEAEWDRVAESAAGSSASGVADRAATIAGIRAVHAALLAKIKAADKLLNEAHFILNEADAPIFPSSDWNKKWLRAYRAPQPAGGGEKSDEFAPAPPDKTYQHALVRRLWEAQLGDLSDDVKRLMAEAATEIEGHLPATDDFVNSMRRKHAKVIR